jgi:polar amino acid transport system substrate-binding protein
MKKFLTLILTLVLALGACFGLTACNKKTVTVGYTEVVGLNYTDENGKLVGFDTELAEKVFGDLGYEIRFKLINWDNKYTEVNSGTIDVIWNGFTANCADKDGIQRSEKVDFSYNYMMNAQAIIKKATSPELTDLSQLDGTSVAFESGSAAETLLSEIQDANINDKPCASQLDAIREVNSGTAQYAIVDFLLAKSIAGKGDYADIAINEAIELPIEYYAIGFKKGSDLTAKVNEKLVEYAESGYLAQLAEKYGYSNQVITDYSDQINK